jgi:transcription elongation factor GreA
MAKREYILTAEGAARLRQELAELKGAKRTELAARLRHAVQMGDLSENADYIMAKEDQAFLEGRILELETLLREATIAEEAQAGVVTIGATVLVSEADGPPETFQVVGMKEADPRRGKVSHESPIGQALLGHRVGDTVQAETPGGTLTFQILEIR